MNYNDLNADFSVTRVTRKKIKSVALLLHYCDFEKKKRFLKMKKAFHFSIQCKDISELLFQRTFQIPLIIYGVKMLKARGKGRAMINKNKCCNQIYRESLKSRRLPETDYTEI